MQVYQDELYHHGIKGMKWGVRRYQNKDGTLTSEGKRRHNYDETSDRATKKKAREAEMRKSIKDYRTKYDRASSQSDHADELWKDVKSQYTALGKNRVERAMASMKNKTAAAKAYNKAFEKASSASDSADAAWQETYEAYKKTGRNRVSRIINNMKYDMK